MPALLPALLPRHPAHRAPAPTPSPRRPDGLWWLGSGRAVSALRRLLLLCALGGFLLALEERVVFHSFNQYIRLTAPWNYIAVTGEGAVGYCCCGAGCCGMLLRAAAEGGR